MQEYLDFFARHWVLSAAALILIVLLIATEISNKLRKFKDISPIEAARIVGDDDKLVLDVREPDEFKSGHLRGAKLIPLGSLVSKLPELEKFKDKTVLVYCLSGDRSVKAAKILCRAGFSDVSNLAGGIIAWQSEHYPVKK
ncbi:MAG TPA: rhodanese-like domain-containing protein [Halothiobacillus sp.]|nr:rhodanese-like domain-containing protein [Halothiobacillus sp.]